MESLGDFLYKIARNCVLLNLKRYLTFQAFIMNFYSLSVFIALVFSFNAADGHRCHRRGNGEYGGGSEEVVVIGAEKPDNV